MCFQRPIVCHSAQGEGIPHHSAAGPNNEFLKLWDEAAGSSNLHEIDATRPRSKYGTLGSGSRTVPICQVVLSYWGLWGTIIGTAATKGLNSPWLQKQMCSSTQAAAGVCLQHPLQVLLFGGYPALKASVSSPKKLTKPLGSL
eukprot:s2676_g2.t1